MVCGGVLHAEFTCRPRQNGKHLPPPPPPQGKRHWYHMGRPRLLLPARVNHLQHTGTSIPPRGPEDTRARGPRREFDTLDQ